MDNFSTADFTSALRTIPNNLAVRGKTYHAHPISSIEQKKTDNINLDYSFGGAVGVGSEIAKESTFW